MKRSAATWVLISTTVLGACGMMNGMDALGRESAVTETKTNKAVIEDDKIEDKHPAYDPNRSVIEVFEGRCAMQLNKSGSVTKLDIVTLSDENADLKDRIFASRREAADFITGRLDNEHSLIPSIETVNGAMKPFNDGLYAAVELAVEDGVAGDDGETVVYPAKKQFLHDLLAAVLAVKQSGSSDARYFDAAAADMGAALLLAGETPNLPSDLLSEAEALVDQFEGAELYSRPIGFYTWNDALGRIFSQDRFLQNYQGEEDPYAESEVGKAAALCLALESDDTLLERYEGYLALYAGLTNPFMNHPVTALSPYLTGADPLTDIGAVTGAFLQDFPPPDRSLHCQPRFALFPSSKSKETDYFESLFCRGGAPSGIDYMETLITGIREGLVDLTPDADSGWYDYQSHALEVLLLPERGTESDHLLLTAAYKKKLIESFKSLITQNRETHVKQLEMGKSDAADVASPVDIYPQFPVEPFPTFYLRSARAYRFLSTYLSAVLGSAVLETTNRLLEDGTASSASLTDALHQKAELLYGLHLLTADATGTAPALLDEELAEFDETDARAAAQTWVRNWREDADVNRDSRVIVPVQREEDAVVYWATLGTRVIETSAEFYPGFEPDVDGAPYDALPESLRDNYFDSCPVKGFVPHNYYMLVDTFAEVRLPSNAPPPTRDELRAILDEYDNAAEMVRALEAR